MGILNKLVKRCLALGRPPKEQEEALSWKRINNHTQVVAGSGQRMHITPQGDELAVVDGRPCGRERLRLPERNAAGDGSEYAK